VRSDQHEGRQSGAGRRGAPGAGRLALACWAASGLVLAQTDPPQPLQQWAVDARSLPAWLSFWFGDVPGLRAEAAAEPDTAFPEGLGAIAVRVTESPCARPADMQLYCVGRQGLGQGGVYRVSLWLKATRETTVETAVIRDEAPWTAVGASPAALLVATTEWQQHQFDFTPDQDFPADVPVRSPYLGLGCVAPGTTVWVAGLTLFEVMPPPPQLPILRSDELLTNPGFETALSGWTPQAAEISPVAADAHAGPGACLVTKRTARWGTPTQDLRAALSLHGPGFYEFGAWVRPVQGAGEASAVIHLRDDTGDHWVTSDARPLRRSAYTRLDAQRYLTWTGPLQAADIGIQTPPNNTADVLVDDFTLRALTDLARARPVTSGGDAPGHPAAAACDGDPETAWEPSAMADAWIEVDLGQTVAFNTCVLGEQTSRLRSYVLEAWDGEQWAQAFAGGGLLGRRDRLHFGPTRASKVRLRLTRADGPPAITELALFTTNARETTVRIAPPPADPARRGERTLVGAIRWDGWCGDRSPVGLGLEQALAPERYHHRLPFYARVLGPGQVQVRCTTQEVMDREIAFAKEAGIDYWAFDWYEPDSGLAAARSLYLSSRHRDEVKWCVILGTGPLSAADQSWLIEQFRSSNYQKVLGDRPLVYVFNASRKFAPLVRSLREYAAAAGCPTPFVVYMGWGAAIAEPAAQSGADALGAYVNPYANRSTFAENMAHERQQWEALRQTGCQMVPTVTTGWDPRPFLDHPVAWYPGATESNWVEQAEPDQLAEQLSEALAFVRDHPEASLANTVLIYAWNENAEGGWIIPTLPEIEAGLPARLDALRGVLRPDVPRGSGWTDLVR